MSASLKAITAGFLSLAKTTGKVAFQKRLSALLWFSRLLQPSLGAWHTVTSYFDLGNVGQVHRQEHSILRELN